MRLLTMIMHLLIVTRFYDERKPLESAYSSVSALKARRSDEKENAEGLEVQKLLHAPPG